MRRAIGIDLGTTNSAGVVMKDGKMRMVPAKEGPTPHGKMFPSTVAFRKDGEIIVGKEACEYALLHPERTVRWIKRRMGTNYAFIIDGVSYTPQDISALILKKIKTDAENFIGERIEQGVITVPAYFNNNQRNATKSAGEMAGLNVLRIISEPTAAALAYGLGIRDEELTVAILDLGAGTFDITILRLSDGLFSVKATSGDTELGGKDMDDILLAYVTDQIKEKHGVDITASASNMAILRNSVEKAKIQLSQHREVTFKPHLVVRGSTFKPRIQLARDHLKTMLEGLVSKLDEPMQRVLSDAKIETDDVDRLVLVGGPTRMPLIREHIQGFFGIKPEEGIDPMGVVATGAYIQASMLEGEIRDLLLLDVTPLSLGIETAGGVFTRLIPRNTTIPTERRRVFATAEDNQTIMMIHVLQGEREMASDNTSLGLLKIEGIPVAPRFEEDVKVAFKIDADGLLQVSAEVLGTGKENKINILNATNVPIEELIDMTIEATRHEFMDLSKRARAKSLENAEAILYGARKTIQRIEKKITEGEKKELTRLADELELGIIQKDMSLIEKRKTGLTRLVEALSNKVVKLEEMRLLISSYTGLDIDSTKNIGSLVRNIENAELDEVDKEMGKLREALMIQR
jgi:molecular chaperone DnaK